MIKFVDLMGSTSTGVISYGLSKYKVAIPAYGYLRRLIGHYDVELGNALKDDPEGEYLTFNELSATVIPNWGGAANRYAAISIELDTNFFRETLGMSDKQCLSQEIAKDI